MKNLFLFVSILLVYSTSFAGLNKEAFYKAYREYIDRGAELLPLSNDKIVIEKVVDIGKSDQGLSIYTVYLETKLGLSQYSSAVQVAADQNGEIDSYKGILSISSTMITDSKGKDARFPLGLSEVQYALLVQKAFEVAQRQYAQVYLDPTYVGTFYVQTGFWNEKDKTFSLEFSSRGLPGHKSKSRMTLVTVEMNSITGQVIKFYKRDY